MEKQMIVMKCANVWRRFTGTIVSGRYPGYVFLVPYLITPAYWGTLCSNVISWFRRKLAKQSSVHCVYRWMTSFTQGFEAPWELNVFHICFVVKVLNMSVV